MQSAQAREPDATLGGQAVDQGSRSQDTNLTVEVVPTADEVVEDLRAQMADLDTRDKEKDAELIRERDRAAAAERARVDAENRARRSEEARASAEQTGQRSVDAAQLDSIKNSLTSHEAELTSLASKKAALNAEGNFEEAAKLDAQMAKLGGRIAQLEAGRDELDARVKAPPAADTGRQPDQQQPSADQQWDDYVRGQPPRVQDWLRSDNGRRFRTDPDFRNRVSAAAKFATDVRQIPASDPRYIEFVEEEVGLRQRAVPDTQAPRDDRQPSPPSQGRTADTGRVITAPAGGSSAGSVRTLPGGQIEVYLTEGEREMGRRQGITDAELAAAKRDLLREGLIGPGARNQ